MESALKFLPRSLEAKMSQACKKKTPFLPFQVKSPIYNSSPLTINAAYILNLRLKKLSEESLFQQGEILENPRNTNLLISLEGFIV